jgi:pyruvate dehydrogenase E2 component (dihydrolipoamide acetyltransferase)
MMSSSSLAPAPKRMSRLRRTVARRMRESVTTKPQVTLHTTAPADALLAVAERTRGSAQPVGLTALVAHATARTLLSHELLNGHVSDDMVTSFEGVNLGIAVDAPGGLMVPVIHNAHELGPAQTASAIGDLAARARAGTLAPAELFDATFTVSTLGAYGVEEFTPIINPPEIAMLGVGAVRSVLELEDGQPVVRHVLHLSLTFDHAAVDGGPAARFLAALVTTIGAPDSLKESS